MRHRLLTGWPAAVAAVVLLCPVTAFATSRPEEMTLSADWASADLTIVRDGWTVLVTGTVTDTRDDDNCVYVKSKLVVDDYYDQDERTGDLCAGPGSSRAVELELSPAYGSRLVRVELGVCAADRLADSCEEGKLLVPPERAVQPDLRDEIDRYMRMPMSEFLEARTSAPGPFDWDSDGCTDSPDQPNGWNFRDACYRHDFGYRNYGGGPIQASPTDETRADTDNRLRDDLLDECGHVEERRRCEALAHTYYGASRKAGGRSFYD